MKQGIHPDYHKIKVVLTDGTSFETRSTLGNDGHVLQLSTDRFGHPAWTGGDRKLVDTDGQYGKFNKKYQGFGF